jgi:hypothetical protein
MTTPRPQHIQRQLLLALLLFLVVQLALTLHSHDLSLHSADAGECVVCLVGSANDHALISDIPITTPVVQHGNPPLLSAGVVFACNTKHTYSRAPPVLLI